MTPRRSKALIFLVAGLAALSPLALAAPVEKHAFRVCQDPNNLPFSNTAGEGYENKIAEVFARDLKLPLEYYSFPQRLAFVRNTLRYKLPGEDYRCDVMIGVPAGYDQVSATKPYYRSTYALIFPKHHGLDGVRSEGDFLKLGPEKLKALKIGLFDRSPASQWLVRHDLVDQGEPYLQMNPNSDESPATPIARDLEAGKIDAAILWGPQAAYMAKTIRSKDMVVVPMQSEPGVVFDYAMAMGVRYGEPDWKSEIQGLIDRHQGEINAILRSYGVPMLPLQPVKPGR